MVGVKNQKDPRDGLHHGGWMMKVICWCLLVIFMFFLPNEIISFYETASKFGSGLFLLVQVVLLLDFVHGWNDKWVGYDEQFWYAALLVVSLFCYVATFSFAGLLFYLFIPSGHDCGLNTLIFALLFAKVTLHPAVSGRFCQPQLYLCTAHISAIVDLLVNQGNMLAMVFTSILKRSALAHSLLGCLQLCYLLSILLFVQNLLRLCSPPQVHLEQVLGSLCFHWTRQMNMKRKKTLSRSHTRIPSSILSSLLPACTRQCFSLGGRLQLGRVVSWWMWGGHQSG